jgi:hypothetical protein
MTTYYLSPISTILQYFTDSGIVLSNGKVNTYLAGTSTPTATYTDITGVTPNANPIILSSAGRLPNVSIWQPGGVALKVVVTDALNNQIGPTFDQISGINDPTSLTSSLAASGSGSGADLVANAVRSFDIVSSVRSAGAPTIISGQTRIIDTEGANAINDGFGGLFYWNASSSATDDGISVIKPTGVSGNGRYLRQKNSQFYASKPSSTARTSVTTLSADPDLLITVPISSGTYSFEGLLLFNGSGGGGGGISVGLYTGSTLVNNPAFVVLGRINAAAFNAYIGGWNASVVTSSFSAATITASGSGNDAVHICGTISGISGSGNFGISWAQNSSSANSAQMLAGSWIRLVLAQ